VLGADQVFNVDDDISAHVPSWISPGWVGQAGNGVSAQRVAEQDEPVVPAASITPRLRRPQIDAPQALGVLCSKGLTTRIGAVMQFGLDIRL